MDDDTTSFLYPSLFDSADTKNPLLDSDNNLLGGGRCRTDDYDEEDKLDKLYLVPYKWWREAGIGEGVGVKYDVLVHDSESDEDGYYGYGDDDEEIVMKLIMKEDGSEEEGFSGREYALVSGLMWVRALKW